LRRIVRKGVAADRKERYQSASALRDDLEAYLESTGDRSTLKDVGQLVATSFAEQRERLRTIIERCIADSKEPQGGRQRLLSLASIDDMSLVMPDAPLSGPPPGTSGHTMKMEAANLARQSTPASSSSSGSTPQASTVESVATSELEDHQRVNPVPFIVASSLGFFGVAIIIVALTMGRKPPPAPTTVVEVRADSRGEPSVSVATTTTTTTGSGVASTSASVPTTTATESATASASATTESPPPPRPAAATPRQTWYHPSPKAPPPRFSGAIPPAPIPTPIPAAPTRNDCTPPYYFDGTKKIFKPGCL
jgi:serine/threonine-protein kinase